MIERFPQNLPYTLTQPMFREYEAKASQLQRWLENTNSSRVRSYLEQSDTLQFVIALGICYRYVIAPIAGSEEFVSRLRASHSVNLKLGGRMLDSGFTDAIGASVKQFAAITTSFGLQESFFAETDVRRIVFRLIELDERGEGAE